MAESIPHHLTELALCREIGDRFGEQRALGSLGGSLLIRQSPAEAITVLQQQLELATDIDAPTGRAFALVNLGQFDQAIAVLTAGLDDARRHSYRDGEIWALTLLATAWHLTGDIDRARRYAEQAVTASHDLRDTQVRRDALAEYDKLRPTHAPG